MTYSRMRNMARVNLIQLIRMKTNFAKMKIQQNIRHYNDFRWKLKKLFNKKTLSTWKVRQDKIQYWHIKLESNPSGSKDLNDPYTIKFHLSLWKDSFSLFFKIGIHSRKGWTRHGVARKRSTKRLKHTGNMFRKNLQLKDVC